MSDKRLLEFGEQSARDLQANLGKYFAMACAHASQMTLQRTSADLERTSRAIKGYRVTMPQ
ncbi:hypothetical protein ACQPTN_17500 [Bradyrhizobium sp. 13971]